MSKKTVLLFTDECGNYKTNRSENFLKAHPFYVRANLIIGLDEYLKLEEKMNRAKESAGIPIQSEIKWAHYGSALKGRGNQVPGGLNAKNLENYFESILTSLNSAKLYYTITDNSCVPGIDEVTLIKMHLQNAYQTAQRSAEKEDSHVFIIADDMGDKNKAMKKVIYSLTTEGDVFTKYKDVNNGLFIDYSDQCCGLQVADICAGVFTASLKYIISNESEKHKYQTAYGLFTNVLYKFIRYNDYHWPYCDTYASGIKQIPSYKGKKITQKIADIASAALTQDYEEELLLL